MPYREIENAVSKPAWTIMSASRCARKNWRRRCFNTSLTPGRMRPEHLPKLKDAGIKVVISLRPHSEANGDREATKIKELGMSYFNIPVIFNEPDELDADDFLKLTDEQLKNGPVFIHCAVGTRVGAFWMIRRVLRDGWEFDKALEEANRIGLRNQAQLLEFAKAYIDKRKKK